ncbi:MAG: DCC1-like thiol-disulfide oxidoreductase family protein [Proteobacteria bacterium]|nr:DCC1-like thiol-disulfide oxidoreductase family protein [Pseudomonadota bacterium]
MQEQSQPKPEASGPPIVFFDGVCGLCNGFVDFLLRVDQRELLRFATLQGPTAQHLLGSADAGGLTSVVFIDGGVVKTRSDAVAAILRRMDWPWRVAGFGLKVLPALLRDAAYDLVAQNRYRLFGVKATCRIPSAAERRRFLD